MLFRIISTLLGLIMFMTLYGQDSKPITRSLFLDLGYKLGQLTDDNFSPLNCQDRGVF